MSSSVRKVEETTGKVRWVERGASKAREKVLQQQWRIGTVSNSFGGSIGHRYEWRDVPVEDEADA